MVEPEILQARPGLYAIDTRPLGVGGFISTYVLLGREVAVIDPGPSCSIPVLIKGLEALGVEPSSVRYVLATHIHIDHAGGAGRLLAWAREAELLVHPRGVKHMADPSRLWEGSKAVLGRLAELYGRIEPVERERISELREGDEVSLAGGPTIQVLETPGHASHHLSFFEPEEGILFSGDSAGVYVRQLDLLIPTTPPPFRLDLALASLEKQAELRPRLLCYTHFAWTDRAVEKLRAHMEQLQLWARVAEEHLEEADEELLEALLAEDPELARHAQAIREHPLLTGVIRHSIKGLKALLRSRTAEAGGS